MEKADREEGSNGPTLERTGRATMLDQVPFQAATRRASSSAQLLPQAVPLHHQRHRGHREQLEMWEAQSAAHQLQVFIEYLFSFKP